MQKFIASMEWVISRSGFLLLLLMSFVIGLQVFMRYVMDNALIWPEEMTRYCYLWASMLAISLTEHHGSHLRIDVLKNLMGKKYQKFFDMAACLGTLVFYIIFIYYSFQMLFMIHMMDQYATSFEMPMVFVWAAFPILSIVTLLFALFNGCRQLCGKKEA